ncbi:MAG TPA: thioesterase family protein [Pseudolabrys sp.]|nr:thioesterase family protein [Pseudolabrys sp.]
MTSFVYRRQAAIEWGHCDPAGIVFNARYFEFFDVSTWLLFEAALGVKRSDLNTAFGIIGLPLVDARAAFRAPAKFGDTIEIASHVKEFRRSSFDVEHLITIGGKVAVEGAETRVWAGKHASDPHKISAVPLPADVIARFDRT